MSLINYLTRIHFAEHVLEDALGLEIARLGGRRPLILFDPDGAASCARSLIEDTIPASCAAMWCEESAFACDTADMPCRRDRDTVKSTGCDLVVAFGGTAAQEAGRRIAVARSPRLPLVAIPTTTSDIGLPTRATSAHPVLPDAILCDPTLTYWLASDRTAAHGFDALTRCIEAFLAPGFNPPADGIALEGVHLLSCHLEAAVTEGDLPEPRRYVMAAALNAALAGQKGLGGVEALTRAISAECGAGRPQGYHHASVLPRVLNFNEPAVGDRYARLAVALQTPPKGDPIQALTELGTRIGLPDRIGHLGLAPAALRRVARNAAADPASQTNPRHATQADYLDLLAQAV